MIGSFLGVLLPGGNFIGMKRSGGFFSRERSQWPVCVGANILVFGRGGGGPGARRPAGAAAAAGARPVGTFREPFQNTVRLDSRFPLTCFKS